MERRSNGEHASDEVKELTDLERAVLEKGLSGNYLLFEELRKQLPSCRVSGREHSGQGFFAYLVVPPPLWLDRRLGFDISDVQGEIPGLWFGAGFVIYIREGHLDLLEGYTYDEPWPDEVCGFRLKYSGTDTRDWSALSTRLAGFGPVRDDEEQ